MLYFSSSDDEQNMAVCSLQNGDSTETTGRANRHLESMYIPGYTSIYDDSYR